MVDRGLCSVDGMRPACGTESSKGRLRLFILSHERTWRMDGIRLEPGRLALRRPVGRRTRVRRREAFPDRGRGARCLYLQDVRRQGVRDGDDGHEQPQERSWFNHGIDLLRSDDLIHWESVAFDFRKGASVFSDPDSPDVYRDYAGIKRVWAPQIFWDPAYVWPDGKKGGYMIYYSLWNPEEEKYDRMYYSYADHSFTTLTKPRLMFDWGYATIDADINYVPADGKYHMLIKKEGGTPGIFAATADKLTGPYRIKSETDYVRFEGNRKCEGCSAFN